MTRKRDTQMIDDAAIKFLIYKNTHKKVVAMFHCI